MSKYLFRIDDICPEMDWDKFERLISLFKSFKVPALLAVVPDNQDDTLRKYPPNPNFWQRIKELIDNGFVIGMHGYQHKYLNKNGGLLNIHQGSEFAGLPYETQSEKIKKGKEILEEKEIKTDIFIAPGHSFDKNTIKALRAKGFKYISDGIALWPFEKHGITWIPQIAWKPKKMPLGIITFCLHPNNFSERNFQQIKRFIKDQKEKVVDFTWSLRWYRKQGRVKKLFFYLANIFFKLIWYLRFNISKLKNKTNVRN